MKNISLFVCMFLLFPLSILGQGESINKNNPFGVTNAELKTEGNRSYIEIIQPLNKATTVDLESIPLSEISCRLKVIKVFAGVSYAGNSEEIIVNSSLNLKFKIDILSNYNDNPFSLENFGLPTNWSKFEYEVSCRGVGFVKTKQDFYEKSASAVQKNISVTFSKPIVVEDIKTQIIIPISAPITMEAKVQISDAEGEITSENVHLIKNKKDLYFFTTKRDINKEFTYTIKIEPADFQEQGVKTLLNQDSACNVSQDSKNSCKWKASYEKRYTLLDNTITELTNYTISSSSESKIIRIFTTDYIKDLRMKVGDKEIGACKYKDNESQIFCDIKLLPAGIPDGKNNVIFEGESKVGVKFVLPKALSISKTAQPTVVSPPKFNIENNKLRVEYELSGDLKSSKAVLSYRGKTGTEDKSLTLINDICANTAKNTKSCVFEMTLAGFNISDDDKKLKSVPITLNVSAIDSAENSIVIDSMELKLVNQGFVETSLERIKKKWEANSNESNKLPVLQDLAELLTGSRENTNDETVKQSFDAVKKGSGDGKNKLLFGILKFVGNTALSYFGVPVKF